MNRFWIKLIVNAIVVVPLLIWFSEATLWGSLLAAVVLCVAAYLIGDQWILRATNNLVATLADAGLTFLFLWLVAFGTGWDLSLMEILIISAVLGVVEWFYHSYLGRADEPARAE
ncbi:YndM family protein [Brevibacillus humidisoli]|uniref:DUF2512 family protein n=1 Tax=Brevibacillus humidisoli TaxID=2895522 RepID=UPI001E57C22C|nr:DUF2512 family protein [Brevibacillus humidisoli]UFJ41825.1 YndM family protein [Brevibacillus humidisoli]